MKWKEFMEACEGAGIRDDTEIEWIDVHPMEKIDIEYDEINNSAAINSRP
jgi:hypothetical protein